MTSPLTYLSSLCRRWGGELLLVSSGEFHRLLQVHDRTYHPTGHHAIDRGQRLVIARRDHANPGTVIHEMGHVFLDEGIPSRTYEPDWLGWEIVLARRARCFRAWSKQNDNYIVGDFYNRINPMWSELDHVQQRSLIADRIYHAQALGIVSQSGEPLCTRSR